MHLRRRELTQFSLTQRSGRSRAPPWLDSRQWGPNEKSDHEAGPRLGVTEGEGPRPTLDVGLEAWVALTVAGMCRLDSESVQPGPRKSPPPLPAAEPTVYLSHGPQARLAAWCPTARSWL